MKRRILLSLALLSLVGDTVRADLLHPRATDFAAKYNGFTMIMGPTRRLVYAFATGTLHLMESRDGKLVEIRTRDLWSYVVRMMGIDLDRDGQEELVGYTADARIFVLRGTDLTDIWNTPVNRYREISALTFGDIDQDGQIEIVFIADKILRVFSAFEDVEEWKSAVEFLDTDIEMGDVDGDGRDDLVFNGGRVFDAYYRNLKWTSEMTYGFGVEIDLFDIDSDGILEVIGEGADGLIRIWDIDVRRMKFN